MNLGCADAVVLLAICAKQSAGGLTHPEVLTLEELHGIATERTDPGRAAAAERYDAVDVWTGATLSAVTGAAPWAEKGLAPHNSTFVMFVPVTVR